MAKAPVDSEQNRVRKDAEHERASDDVPLLFCALLAVLRVDTLPDYAGNENDNELKEKDVHSGPLGQSDLSILNPLQATYSKEKGLLRRTGPS
jgi:hypothetical protein